LRFILNQIQPNISNISIKKSYIITCTSGRKNCEGHYISMKIKSKDDEYVLAKSMNDN